GDFVRGGEEPLPEPAGREAVPVGAEAVADGPTTALRIPTLAEVARWACLVHAAGAALMLLRWLFGLVGLWWLVRGAVPVPVRVRRLAEGLGAGGRVRLLASRRVRVPFSYGLWRPTVVLPAALAAGGTEEALR